MIILTKVLNTQGSYQNTQFEQAVDVSSNFLDNNIGDKDGFNDIM